MDQSIPLGRDSTYPQPNSFIYGVGPAIRGLERMIGHIAPTDIPVLLVGESGTGKEQIALEIHYRSQQYKEAFLKFDCREVPGQLSPAWLSQYGSSKIGETNNGTIFFDEISQLAPTSQDELLQLLAGENTVASGPSRRARMISATARSLDDEVRDGRFREELYYTINGISLLIPSLRNRREDIPALVDLFLRKHAAVFSRSVPQLASSTMDLLVRYTWPGNVRELEGIARKVVELGDELLALRYFSNVLVPTGPTVQPVFARHGTRSLKEAVREASENVERDLIVKTLERTHWNRKQAARELQISPRTLCNKMEQLGLKGTSDS
jgi:two-component system, NtrC family, response regulator AtoC